MEIVSIKKPDTTEVLTISDCIQIEAKLQHPDQLEVFLVFENTKTITNLVNEIDNLVHLYIDTSQVYTGTLLSVDYNDKIYVSSVEYSSIRINIQI